MSTRYADRKKPIAHTQTNSHATNNTTHINKSVKTSKRRIRYLLINTQCGDNYHTLPEQQVLQSTYRRVSTYRGMDSHNQFKNQTDCVIQSMQSCCWQRCLFAITIAYPNLRNRNTNLQMGFYVHCEYKPELSIRTRTLPRAPLIRTVCPNRTISHKTHMHDGRNSHGR